MSNEQQRINNALQAVPTVLLSRHSSSVHRSTAQFGFLCIALIFFCTDLMRETTSLIISSPMILDQLATFLL